MWMLQRRTPVIKTTIMYCSECDHCNPGSKSSINKANIVAFPGAKDGKWLWPCACKLQDEAESRVLSQEHPYSLLPGHTWGTRNWVRGSRLPATIPAVSYSGQSTRRILPGIPLASDRGVYSLDSCFVQFLRWVNNTWDPQRIIHCHFNWWLSRLHNPFYRWHRFDGGSNNELQDLTTHWLQVPAQTAWEST